jgi:methoxymalonate biosynthesis acyl carrier protein
MMPTDASIEHRVGRLFLGVDAPSPDTDVFETGVLDFVALVQLIVDIEEEFGVELPLKDVDVDEFRTIDRIAPLIRRVAYTTDSV